MKKCPHCGATVTVEQLSEHIANTHNSPTESHRNALSVVESLPSPRSQKEGSGFSRRATLAMAGTGIAAGAVGFSGSVSGQENPSEIEDWHDLNAIRDGTDEDYILTRDLDSETAGYDEYVGDPEAGWEPIEDDYSLPFTGSLDGQSHSITDLKIDRPGESDVGLFADLSGTVERLDLEKVNIIGGGQSIRGTGAIAGSLDGKIVDCNVTGEIDGAENIGGIVGYESDGEVANCSVDVKLTGDSNVGGIVGDTLSGIIKDVEVDVEITGQMTPGGLDGAGGVVGGNSATVERAVVSGRVTGFDRVGGIVGTNGGLVTESAADVTIEGEERIGGAIGSLGSGRVNDIYAHGSVTGIDTVGGLIGVTSSDTIVRRCYSTGKVTGEFDLGGLIGRQFGSIVEDAYWDITETGLDDSDGGIGLSTDEMQGDAAKNNMTGLDFETTWQTQPDGYPTVRALPNEATDESGVENPDDPLSEYRNDKNEVDINGLRTAINDFASGNIDIQILRDVIRVFTS